MKQNILTRKGNTIMEKMKKEAIFIDLKDEGGSEVYKVIDKYRFEKEYTWKQLILQAVVFAMLQDGVKVDEVNKVIKYMTK
jgi:hypothetical protein